MTIRTTPLRSRKRSVTHSALYLSPRWFDLLQQEAQRALDAAPRPFSAALLERYHGEADRWRVDGYLPGFRIDFANGVARVRPGALPGESANLVLEMSWSDAHRVCAQRGGPGLDELLGAMIADGRLRVNGDLSVLQLDLNAFHDRVSERTLFPAGSSTPPDAR